MTESIGKLLGEFTEESKQILGNNLAGIYLHGSAAMGCFNPEKSDIDLIIVVHRPLSGPAKRTFMDMVVRYHFLGPAKGIEMSVVLREVCSPFVYPIFPRAILTGTGGIPTIISGK